MTHWVDKIADLAPSTRSGYKSCIRVYITPALGKTRLDKLKAEHVETLYAELRKRVSAGTLRKVHAILARALKVAHQRGHVARKIMEHVQPPKVPVARSTSMSVQDARRVIRQAVADGEGARWTLALMCGLRPGEALGLDWSCIDGDVLHVRQQLQKVPGERLALRRLTKTTAGYRSVPLPEVVVQLLAQRRQQQLEQMVEAGERWESWTPPGEHEPVLMCFTNTTGTPTRPDYDLRAWHRLLERAGVSDTRRYTARHTAASLQIAEGVDVATVAAQLGHRDSGFTYRTYVHALDEKHRAAADLMGRLLG